MMRSMELIECENSIDKTVRIFEDFMQHIGGKLSERERLPVLHAFKENLDNVVYRDARTNGPQKTAETCYNLAKRRDISATSKALLQNHGAFYSKIGQQPVAAKTRDQIDFLVFSALEISPDNDKEALVYVQSLQQTLIYGIKNDPGSFPSLYKKISDPIFSNVERKRVARTYRAGIWGTFVENAEALCLKSHDEIILAPDLSKVLYFSEMEKILSQPRYPGLTASAQQALHHIYKLAETHVPVKFAKHMQGFQDDAFLYTNLRDVTNQFTPWSECGMLKRARMNHIEQSNVNQVRARLASQTHRYPRPMFV